MLRESRHLIPKVIINDLWYKKQRSVICLSSKCDQRHLQAKHERPRSGLPHTGDGPAPITDVERTWAVSDRCGRTDPKPSGAAMCEFGKLCMAMNPKLESLIRKALADAWAQGIDYKTATERAVEEVLQGHPDMTKFDAAKAVNQIQQK